MRTYTKWALVVVAVLIAALAGAYLYVNNETPEATNPGYDIKKPEEVFLLKSGQAANIEAIVVAGSIYDGAKDIVIKFKDTKNAAIYQRVVYDGWIRFEQKFLTGALKENPSIDFRMMESMSGIGKIVGQANDPTALITVGKAKGGLADLIKILLPMLVLVGALIYTLRLQMGMVSNSFEIARPSDIKDTLDDIVGMQDVKKDLMQLAEMFTKPHEYRAFGADKPFNVMMTGEPGTGKTMMARCLAKMLNVPMIYVSASNLESGFVGGGSGTLRKMFKAAMKLKRCIVFIDEGDSLLAARAAHGSNRYENDTMTALLAILSGVQAQQAKGVIWIIASNFDEGTMNMDAAMLRRWPMKIGFRLPSYHERRELLTRLLEPFRSKLGADINLDHLATITGGMSPAKLGDMTTRASLIAIQEESKITQDILVRAYERLMMGNTDRSPKGTADSKRRIIAIHETGHFIMELHHAMIAANNDLSLLPEKLRVLKISTEAVPKIGAEGYVLSRNEESPLRTRDQLEEHVAELYGGMANEELHFHGGGVTTGAHQDIRQATLILNTMYSEMGFYSHSKVNLRLLAGERGAVDDTTRMNITNKSEEIYRQTLSTLRSYQALSDILVEHLMINHVMTVREAIPIVSEYYKGKNSPLRRYS
ncbi:cell division protease FtsH [Pseudomonas nitritireducens]|uniref:Cell division protease FtsH n=1 Tax=Pseudomonas nitroreducens TaxID=46680 RepID=A0A7W7NZ63_PSENT|nr:AAA family ATPase [Pseudomonas nitritireducens]MBB4861274.1 cell division protease FtsH [Pseudomonas nitritireducens]